MYSLAKLSEQSNKRTPEKHLFSGVLAHLTGFEPVAYRLGELLNNCHTCSPMFKKASNHQAFSHSESLPVHRSSPLSLDVYPLKLAVF